MVHRTFEGLLTLRCPRSRRAGVRCPRLGLSRPTDPHSGRVPGRGPSDIPARIITGKLGDALGHPVLVENKIGPADMIELNDMLLSNVTSF